MNRDYLEKLLELLEYLKEQHFKIAIATSSSLKNTMNHLNEVGILSYFDVIVTGDLVKKAKPDPEIYLTASQKLVIEPQECYALEDSYHGLKAAYYAGMKAILIPDIKSPSEETLKIAYKKLDNLLEVIELLN